MSSRCSVHSVKLLLHVRVSLLHLNAHVVHHASSSMPLRTDQTRVINSTFHSLSFIHSFFLCWSFHLLFEDRHQGQVLILFENVITRRYVCTNLGSECRKSECSSWVCENEKWMTWCRLKYYPGYLTVHFMALDNKTVPSQFYFNQHNVFLCIYVLCVRCICE